jgi:hypothetical protein
MRILLWAGLALALAGCGGDEATAAAEGTWGIQRADGCAVLFSLDASGSCAFGLACELESGEIGVERHEGRCELEDGDLNAYWERSTCADTGRAYGGSVTVSDDQLIWSSDGGRLVFERLEGDGMGSLVIRYGCWEGDLLVFSDLQPI